MNAVKIRECYKKLHLLKNAKKGLNRLSLRRSDFRDDTLTYGDVVSDLRAKLRKLYEPVCFDKRRYTTYIQDRLCHFLYTIKHENGNNFVVRPNGVLYGKNFTIDGLKFVNFYSLLSFFSHKIYYRNEFSYIYDAVRIKMENGYCLYQCKIINNEKFINGYVAVTHGEDVIWKFSKTIPSLKKGLKAKLTEHIINKL